MDGDKTDEILAGPGPSPAYGADVRVFDTENQTISALAGFRAYQTGKYGVKISSGNLDFDMNEEIITGPGPGSMYGSHVRGFKFDGNTVTAMADPSFMAYPGSRYGMHVAAGFLGFMNSLISEGWVRTASMTSAR